MGRECVDGKVVEVEKEKFDFKQWSQDNKFTILILLIVGFIIYFIWSFDEPKRRPF